MKSVTILLLWCPYFFEVPFKLAFSFAAHTLYGPVHTKQSVQMFVDAVGQAKQQGGSVVYGGKVIAFVHAFVNLFLKKKKPMIFN